MPHWLDILQPDRILLWCGRIHPEPLHCNACNPAWHYHLCCCHGTAVCGHTDSYCDLRGKQEIIKMKEAKGHGRVQEDC